MSKSNLSNDLNLDTSLGTTLSVPHDEAVHTLGDLAKAIVTDPGLPMALRKRLICDLERLFVLDPALRATRALGLCVEPRLARLHPTNTNLSQKRLDNLKASARLAIRHHHTIRPGATYGGGLRGVWANTYGRLPPHSAARVNLSRFCQWCQRLGIDPDQVTNETIKAYEPYLRDVIGDLKPTVTLRAVVNHWNRAIGLDGWPTSVLTAEIPVRPELELKDETMGPALVNEIGDYLHFMEFGGTPGQERDVFDLADDEDFELQRKSTRHKAARPATIKGRRHTLRRAVGLLTTATGKPANQFSLRDLTVPKNASAILKEYRRHLGGDASAPGCESMAYALVGLGRYHKVDAKAQFQLDKLARSAAEARRDAARSSGPSKMTAKNIERLRQIGPTQVKALFRLPATLLNRVAARIKVGRATSKDMIDAQIAVAIAILLHVPLRAANTVSIEIGKQLLLPATDSEESVLNFEYTVVKNSFTLRFKLPPDVTALIRRYMTEFQPHFGRTNNTLALFPGTHNPHKTTTSLGAQIAARVQTAIGVKMNQHLFRHFAALLYLKRHPGEYVAVQRLLGHKNLKTTLEYYTGPEIDALLDHITASMAAVKAEMGLNSTDMSRLIDEPKHRRQRKTEPEPKARILRGVFTRAAVLVSARGSVAMATLIGNGQGMAGQS